MQTCWQVDDYWDETEYKYREADNRCQCTLRHHELPELLKTLRRLAKVIHEKNLSSMP